MALRLRELNPDQAYTYLCTPTGDELPETLEHWKRMEEKLGPITYLRNHTLDFWTREFNALPNWRQRWCTRLLKVEPCIAYIKSHSPCVLYVGLRADEKDRAGLRDYGDSCEYRFPLQEWNWGLLEVNTYLKWNQIDIPRRTDCARCPFQKLIEWRWLAREHPDVYESAMEDEERTGHTYRSENKDAWPASLRDLRDEFRTGRKIRNEDIYEEKHPCRICKM